MQKITSRVIKTGNNYYIQRLWLSKLLGLDRNYFFNFSTQFKYREMYQYYFGKVWIDFQSFCSNFQMSEEEIAELIEKFEVQLKLQSERGLNK